MEKEQNFPEKNVATIKNNTRCFDDLIYVLIQRRQRALIALAYNLYYLKWDTTATAYFIVLRHMQHRRKSALSKMAQKLGRKVQAISISVALLGYLGILLLGWWPSVLPFTIWTLGIFGILVFSGQALFYMASIINMTNCVEYNEYKQGERNEAVVSTLRPFMVKFASAVQYGVVTLILAVSGIFILSQNISLMESQKDYLSNIKSQETQIEYIETIQEYLIVFKNTEDQKLAEEIVRQKLASDTHMAKYQISAEYVKSLSDCKIYRETYVNGKLAKNSKKDLGYWANLDEDDLIMGSGDTVYMISMELMGDNFNAANANFRDQRNLKMRLWLRAAVALAPIALLALSWFIQHKKFIIDEKYYDQMMAEIEKRRIESGASNQ